ncbi:MAG: hypothetical protein H6677_21775 [Candidatus Obscuribacterales bacterium]|nr:hypothetical protein [Cyanobacteria bacterium HKST-UBA01]MCB9470918.1 hypothetical protein [Candidatus Obscuribacterales bacterium]
MEFLQNFAYSAIIVVCGVIGFIVTATVSLAYLCACCKAFWDGLKLVRRATSSALSVCLLCAGLGFGFQTVTSIVHELTDEAQSTNCVGYISKGDKVIDGYVYQNPREIKVKVGG